MDLETVIQSGVSQNEKNKCVNAYVWNLEKWYKERKGRSFSHVQLFVTPWTGHGILQARILEWVAILFSRGSSQPGIKPRSPWVLQEPWFPSKKLQADSLPPKPQLLLLYSKRLQTLVAKLSDTLLSSWFCRLNILSGRHWATFC